MRLERCAELETAKRYREHAQELLAITADKEARGNRQALFRLALDYDRMGTMENIDQTNRTLRLAIKS